MMERDGLYVAKTKIVIFHVKICEEVFSSFINVVFDIRKVEKDR